MIEYKELTDNEKLAFDVLLEALGIDPSHAPALRLSTVMIIAANRIKNRYTSEEVAAWLTEYEGKSREIPMTLWIQMQRDKKAKFIRKILTST